ncbi:hypothetical protein PVAG01_10256 [Phlyctema vagabunda]|uniref:PQ loop repeat protein n=1 Tax=Phlyctema vagabunda TaxID=108571 RepID=A0ABR4P5H2_9HELO
MNVPIAANTLGTLGAVCWSVQLIPQIWLNYQRHNTIGLQRSMMLLWACAGVPLGAYNIVSDFNIALQIQPQILTILSLITWIQCYHYDDKWAFLKCSFVIGIIGALFGGIEAALVFALKAGIKQDHHWPLILMGVLSALLLSAGVLRHYYDIYVERTVRGISFLFVGIDAAGDVFSLISVFFQPKLDILGIAIYASEFILWCGVFACGGYFNLLPWIRQKRGDRTRESLQHGGLPIENQVSRSAVSNDISLHRVPTSTSVFRTPSSIASRGSSIRSARREVMDS